MTTSTAVSIRQHGTDLIPDGYQPVVVSPPNRLPSVPEYDMMMKIASMAVEGASKASNSDRAIPVGIKTPEQAMTVMLAGYELGMTPFTSLRRVFIVNGKTEIETQALMGLVKASDPSARFIFHEYNRDAVEVELRNYTGTLVRVRYTREDAIDSGQLRERWKRKKDGDGKDVIVRANWNLDPGEKLGARVQGRDGENYVLERVNTPWVSYTRDMLAYSCIKRCCRLGASEYTNMIRGKEPIDVTDYRVLVDDRSRNPGDDLQLANPLTKALAEGKVTPAAVFAGDGPDDSPEPDPPAPQAPSRPAANRRTSDRSASTRSTSDQPAAAPAPAAPPADPNAKVDQDTARKITALMEELKSSWGISWGPQYRTLAANFGSGSGSLSITDLTAGKAADLLAELRRLRGDVAAEEAMTSMTTETPNPANGETVTEPPADQEQPEPTDAGEGQSEPEETRETPDDEAPAAPA